jgi:hypothetical protein
LAVKARSLNFQIALVLFSRDFDEMLRALFVCGERIMFCPESQELFRNTCVPLSFFFSLQFGSSEIEASVGMFSCSITKCFLLPTFCTPFFTFPNSIRASHQKPAERSFFHQQFLYNATAICFTGIGLGNSSLRCREGRSRWDHVRIE